MRALIEPFHSLFRYHDLVWQLTKREITARYRGSMMGVFWSFITPIFMLIIYTFFFSIVYQARWGANSEQSHLQFAIILFAGLIPFSFFAEAINRAPHLIINNVNYVKKVVFPLEILAWINLGSAFFHALISTIVLLCFILIKNHFIPWTVIFFPIINLPLMLIILGLTWFLTSVGVFIRDIAHTITIITTSLLFLSPVFYSTNSIPEPYRSFIYLNPLTTIIEQNRNVLVFGKIPDGSSLGFSFLLGITIAWLGFYWFNKTRPAFADVV